MFRDVTAAIERDPALRGISAYFEVILTYAGLHAILLHRVANVIHRFGVPFIPRAISQIGRLLTGIEIHPAAKIGKGLFIDHGMGVVIGETAIVGEDCTLFQGVTLGGTGKETGKRHPTLGNGVVVGAGAKVLGNITVGDNVYVGANAVVLKDVPPDSTVVGVPGRIVRRKGVRVAAAALDHTNVPDPILQRFDALQKELMEAEESLKKLGERVNRLHDQTDDIENSIGQ